MCAEDGGNEARPGGRVGHTRYTSRWDVGRGKRAWMRRAWGSDTEFEAES